MARYFFHIDAVAIQIDPEGAELADIAAAKLEAVRLLAAVLSEEDQGYWDHQPYRVTVTDHVGLMLFTLDVSANEAPLLKAREPRS